MFSLLGLAKQFFFTVALPSPNQGKTPYPHGPTVAVFRFKSEKKTYQWSQLGKIDPKDYRNKGVSEGPIWAM